MSVQVIARVWLGIAAVGAVAGPGVAQGVADIQVTPSSLTLAVGQRQTLFAAAFDRQGNLLPTATIAFVSSDTAIARVGSDGTVVGLHAGLAKVEARAQNRRAAVAIFVTAPGGAAASPPDPDAAPPASSAAAPPAAGTGGGIAALVLDPPSLALLPGETARLAVRAVRSDGAAAPLARNGWRSLRPDIATVTSDGLITAIAAGEGVIQATAPGISASAVVRVGPAEFVLNLAMLVRPPDMLDTLVATVPAQGGRPVRGGLAWRIADTTIARVGPTGIVQTLAPGETELVASGFGHERRVRIVVFRRPELFVVSPRPSAGPVQVPLTASAEIVARAEAADSTPIPDAIPAWEVGDSSIASFDPGSGLITALRLGTTSLTARLAGFDPVIWVITVVAGEIALDRSRVGLVAGGQGRLLARFAEGEGTPAGLRWSSEHPDIATVSTDGTVTGIRPGSATITATAPWGKTTTARVFVTGDLLVSSSRQATGFALYQVRLAAPDSFVRVLANDAANLQAVWSPDRTAIAASSNAGGNFDIVVADADGGNIRHIAPDPAVDGEPAWTPDGTRIVFSSARAALRQIYSVRADGSDLKELTTSDGGNSAPAVSPDGQSIAFISLRDGNYELYRMDAAGGNAQRLTTTPVRESSPHYFPNGDIAWLTERGEHGGSSIVRRTDDGTVTTLVERPETILSFSISRDGTELAFVTGRILNGGKGRTEFALFRQPATPGAAATPIPLTANEQIVTPAF